MRSAVANAIGSFTAVLSLASVVGGCGSADTAGRSPSDEPIPYTASGETSQEQGPEFGELSCDVDGESASTPVPAAWTTGPATGQSCSYSGGENARIVLSADVPEGDPIAYLPVLEKTLRSGGLKGYERVRADRGERKGDATWIYRYVTPRADGGEVPIEVAEIYRDGWQVTYRDERKRFDEAVVAEIEEKTAVRR